MNEQALFLDAGGERLFAVLHRPVSDTGRGAVFCHPLGEEKLWSHRVLVTFARDLAERGFTVVRIDFRGEGDSDRRFEESSVASRVEDAGKAIEALKHAAPRLREISVLGLRFGTVVAALTAASRADVGRVVLWDPVADGGAYMQSVLRINLAYQMALHRKVVVGREQLVAQMERGGTVNIEGYELGLALFQEACAFRLRDVLPRLAAKSLLVQIGAGGAPPSAELTALADVAPRATVTSVQEEPFWKEIRTFYQRADNLFQATRQWLGGPA